MRSLSSITDVVDWRLCLGCGACAYVCPEHIQLLDFPREGIRPVVKSAAACQDCRDCLDVCPAVRSDYRLSFASPSSATTAPAQRAADALREWGPVTGIWEGHASDPEIRFKGSSGGALTALAAYCLEQAGMHGVLHTGASTDDPIRNQSRLSQSREQLLAAAGSRYAPAAVCDSLAAVENAPAPCAIIGKPAEIAAVRNARKLRPKLDSRVGVTMSFFCAESPSTQGTIALLQKMGVDPGSVDSLRYRGNGWPGHFAPIRKGESEPAGKMTYRDSWAFLQAFRPWSVHQWPDGVGELADISCGDPWYEEPDGRNPGFSLIVARTEAGRKIVEGAIKAGYLTASAAEFWKMERSQPNLLKKKGEVWGRRTAARMLGLPVTQFDGLDLFHCWRQLSSKEKARSLAGTLRRIVDRRLYRQLQLHSNEAIPVRPAAELVFPAEKTAA